MNIRIRTTVKTFLLLIAVICCSVAFSQLHQEVVNYSLNGTPTNGVKIKTNLPFTSSSQMPTIHILGYNYRSGEPIDLVLVYYVFSGAFINFGVTSSGGYQPVIKLAVENSKVVIFIDDKQYFQRFTVSVYAKGMSAESTPASFQDWTAVDQALTGTNVVTVPYKNKITGGLSLPGGVWTTTGMLGIGTTTPTEALSVNGNIRAKEVKVETSGWPDYVFKEDYSLMPLNELGKQIEQKGHLPGLPSAREVETKGQDLGEINKQLLKKVEELTLYILQQQKDIDTMKSEMRQIKLSHEKQ